MKQINIKAEVYFDLASLRNIPIKDGYKPLFDKFNQRFKVSGKISFLGDIQEISKGQKAVVLIVIPEYKEGDISFKLGDSFNFYEGENLIGNGIVL